MYIVVNIDQFVYFVSPKTIHLQKFEEAQLYYKKDLGVALRLFKEIIKDPNVSLEHKAYAKCAKGQIFIREDYAKKNHSKALKLFQELVNDPNATKDLKAGAKWYIAGIFYQGLAEIKRNSLESIKLCDDLISDPDAAAGLKVNAKYLKAEILSGSEDVKKNWSEALKLYNEALNDPNAYSWIKSAASRSKAEILKEGNKDIEQNLPKALELYSEIINDPVAKDDLKINAINEKIAILKNENKQQEILETCDQGISNKESSNNLKLIYKTIKADVLKSNYPSEYWPQALTLVNEVLNDNDLKDVLKRSAKYLKSEILVKLNYNQNILEIHNIFEDLMSDPNVSEEIKFKICASRAGFFRLGVNDIYKKNWLEALKLYAQTIDSPYASQSVKSHARLESGKILVMGGPGVPIDLPRALKLFTEVSSTPNTSQSDMYKAKIGEGSILSRQNATVEKALGCLFAAYFLGNDEKKLTAEKKISSLPINNSNNNNQANNNQVVPPAVNLAVQVPLQINNNNQQINKIKQYYCLLINEVKNKSITGDKTWSSNQLTFEEFFKILLKTEEKQEIPIKLSIISHLVENGYKLSDYVKMGYEKEQVDVLGELCLAAARNNQVENASLANKLLKNVPEDSASYGDALHDIIQLTYTHTFKKSQSCSQSYEAIKPHIQKARLFNNDIMFNDTPENELLNCALRCAKKWKLLAQKEEATKVQNEDSLCYSMGLDERSNNNNNSNSNNNNNNAYQQNADALNFSSKKRPMEDENNENDAPKSKYGKPITNS